MEQSEKTPFSGALGSYLAAIYVLSRNDEAVRITDIAGHLGISKPSVNRAVNALSTNGLVEHKPYGGITLTERGLREGAEICRRSGIVKRFLIETLHIPETEASREADYIIRGVGEDTIAGIEGLNKNT